jgi:hypothetical protein
MEGGAGASAEDSASMLEASVHLELSVGGARSLTPPRTPKIVANSATNHHMPSVDMECSIYDASFR